MTVYADNAATTRMSRTALDAMLPAMEENYGNPSSLHSVGQRAAELLMKSRETVARCLNCQPREIIFTSGGSEADNQALLSAAAIGRRKGKMHIISTAFEHHAILHTLKKLEKEGFLTRTFGGAVLNSASQKEHIHFYKRTSINQKEKAKIAQLFKEVLDQKRTIAADASTTVMEAIRLLKANRNITVLSSSTEIFREMTGSEIHILSTGGVFNEDSLSLQGNLAKENIRRYHVDLALLSCKGLDMDKGIMDSSEREADVKTEMVKQALEVALLADHTKFERTAFVQFLDWDQVTYLVTDERPSDQWVEFCKEKGITLIY